MLRLEKLFSRNNLLGRVPRQGRRVISECVLGLDQSGLWAEWLDSSRGAWMRGCVGLRVQLSPEISNAGMTSEICRQP